MRARHWRTRTRLSLGALCALSLVAAGCGDDDDDSGGDALEEIGEGEGKLNIVAWAYYAEDGSTDPALDWVSPFEQESGCEVTVKVGNTSDEMVQLMKTGQYDVVSASGDATLRLIAAGDVAPINLDLITTYADIFDFLKMTDYNSVDGVAYGVPHGWGANLLMYNSDEVDPVPDSWGAVFDPDSPYAGKVTAYDSPIYIADAALYLMKTQPDLGITNPYALDQTQFDAAIALLEQQRSIIGEYWSDYLKYEEAFTAGSLVLGTTWQVIASTLEGTGVPAATVLPKEGATAWSDTWMVSSKAANPNCAYKWLNYITSPEVQATQTATYGEAPANRKACDLIAEHCELYGAADESFHSQLYYWTTPTKECLDGRDVDCLDYQEWTQAWTELRAG